MLSTLDRIAAALTWLNDGRLVSLMPKTWQSERERFEVYERSARVSQALGAPVLTADEIRRREGLDPLPDDQRALPTSTPPTSDTSVDDRIAALEAMMMQGESDE